MTDDHVLEEFAEKADRILEDMGFDPDGPLDQFNYATGRELGERLLELWPADAADRDRLLRLVSREVVAEFQEMFPTSPRPDTAEIQAYFLGPLISKFITGRGLTVPQLARLADVTPEHVYRIRRAGLSILFVEEAPQPRTGVNRRFSGLDGRQTHLALDIQGVTTRKWPEPVSFVQPFLLGVLDGVRTWLELPEFRVPLEESLKRSLAHLFADPILGDLFDGLVEGAQRVAQRLRDEILVMKTEREKTQRLLDTLVELTNHRSEVLKAFAQAGAALSEETRALPAGSGQ